MYLILVSVLAQNGQIYTILGHCSILHDLTHLTPRTIDFEVPGPDFEVPGPDFGPKASLNVKHTKTGVLAGSGWPGGGSTVREVARGWLDGQMARLSKMLQMAKMCDFLSKWCKFTLIWTYIWTVLPKALSHSQEILTFCQKSGHFRQFWWFSHILVVFTHLAKNTKYGQIQQPVWPNMANFGNFG